MGCTAWRHWSWRGCLCQMKEWGTEFVLHKLYTISCSIWSIYNYNTPYILFSSITGTHCLRRPHHFIISGTPPQSERVDSWSMQWVACQGSCGGDGKKAWCGETHCYSILMEGKWVPCIIFCHSLESLCPNAYSNNYTEYICCLTLYSWPCSGPTHLCCFEDRITEDLRHWCTLQTIPSTAGVQGGASQHSNYWIGV